MKVAHLTTHLNPGGIAVYIYTLAKALRRRGIDQIVISSGGTMEPDFHRNGIPSYVFNLKTKFEFHIKLLMALPGIIALLRKEKIELIHAHTRVTQVLAALIKIVAKIPYVTTIHGFYQPRLGRKIFPAWGTLAIAISDPVKHDLVHTHKIPEKKIKRIRNGIELDRFLSASQPDSRQKARRFWNLSEDDFAICMTSRVITEKGVGDFLKAVHMLSKKYPQVRAFVVGDGPERTKFEKESVLLGLSSRLTFTGNISDIAEILAACDAFVHPVRVPEGFGLSIAEAMACALPVIVTDKWALINKMKDRKIGAIVSSHKPEEIATVIGQWIEQPEELKEMGKNAQATAMELFDINKIADKILGVYNEAVPVKASPA